MNSLFSLGYDAGNDTIHHTFQIISLSRGGWGKARLIRIIRDTRDDNDNDLETTTTNYDPAIHDNTSHYMSHPYTIRLKKCIEFDCLMIEIYWCRNERCWALEDDSEFTPR